MSGAYRCSSSRVAPPSSWVGACGRGSSSNPSVRQMSRNFDTQCTCLVALSGYSRRPRPLPARPMRSAPGRGGQTRGMSNPEIQEHPQILVVGPDGIAKSGDPQDENAERPVTEMVEQPAKVMRIGSMIRQLLEEVRAAP